MFKPETHVRIRSEVKYQLTPGHSGRDNWEIEQVTLDEAETREPQSALEEAALTSRKIVDADDLMAVSQQAINKIASDKSGGTGHENFHFSLIARTRPNA